MDICKLLERKTTSSDNSAFLKNTEKICQEENINASTNNEGVEEDGLSNDIFYLLDQNLNAFVILFLTILLIIWQNNGKVHRESQHLWTDHDDES